MESPCSECSEERVADTDHAEICAGASGGGAKTELDRLRAQNADLRMQVAEVQVVLAQGVLAELARLREENEELKLKGAAVAETWLERWQGLAALLQAPYDLFLVFSIKAAEITAYYGFSYIFVSFVSDEYGLTDREAGNLYAAYGFACTGFGLVLGFVIDRLGVRRSMLVGCTCSTIYRTICALSTSRELIWFASLTFAPVGAAFGVPVLALAVRRYTHRENRTFAFSFFYSMLCLGCLLGSVVINLVRDFLIDDGTEILGVKISWMRMVVWMCTAITCYTMVAAFFVRDIQILSDLPLKEREYCKFKPVHVQVRAALADIFSQAKFWRLAGVTGIFVGVRMTFRHLDATFPKYFIRTYGPQAPFEIILAINPIVEMIGTPLMTGLLLKWNATLTQTLLWGSFVSGISVFVLSIWESYMGAVIFVLVLSLGDTIWSPTLYEFSTMAAAEGKEGMYLAITMAPMYLAALPVGIMSGWALDTFCPKDSSEQERDSRLMWFVIGITGFISPIGLWVFRKRLILPEDDRISGQEAIEADDDGEGEIRRPRRLREAGDVGDGKLGSFDPAGSTVVIGRPLADDTLDADSIPFKA